MFLYNLVVSLYGLAINIASFKKPKARQWVEGRRNWRKKLREDIKNLGAGRIIWIHCASYGEFEQGRPLIDAIRKKHPAQKLLLTFFSPSGFEAFKKYQGVDLVTYLPLDTPANARDFLAIVKPVKVLFIKYEFWINFLSEIQRLKIPAYLVSATFKPHHPFFKPYGGIFIKSLRAFTHLFLQDKRSAELLRSIGIVNHSVTGDTRFDRVMEVKAARKNIDGIQDFKGDSFLLIAGSTWPGDEELLLSALLKLGENVKLILAPHELGKASLHKTVERVEKSGLSYCLFSRSVNKHARVLVLDVMGLLSSVYQYADCAYVGGGFNGGLHNTLEPAVYGIPVFVYGNEHHRYNEVMAMMKFGAVRRVMGPAELGGELTELHENEAVRSSISAELQQYFRNNSNVSGKILDLIGRSGLS